jgi:hypothetical protein
MRSGLASLFQSFRALDDCRIDAELRLSEGAYCLPGMIMKIGDGVVLFREASAFVLERKGMPVHLIFEGGEMKGQIIRSTRDGYLIRAEEPSLQAA